MTPTGRPSETTVWRSPRDGNAARSSSHSTSSDDVAVFSLRSTAATSRSRRGPGDADAHARSASPGTPAPRRRRRGAAGRRG